MNEHRREVIINEIKYWQKTKLLPDQYCNYLLGLYTEGAAQETKVNAADLSVMKAKKDKQARKKKIDVSLSFFLILLIPATFAILFLVDMEKMVKLLVLVAFFIFSLITIIRLAKSPYLIHIPVIVGALILFIGSVEAIDMYVPHYPVIKSIVIITNCGLWLFVGWQLRFIYFTISGSVGIVMLIVSQFLDK